MSKASLFLKLESIPGPSLDTTHKGAIEIDSFNIGASKHNGTANLGELQCSAMSSPADCKLWKSVMEHKEVIKKVTLICRAGGLIDYCTYTFSDCRVTSFSVGGAGSFANGSMSATGAITPSERIQFSLSFAKFELESKEIKPDHSLGNPMKFGYDMLAHKVL